MTFSLSAGQTKKGSIDPGAGGMLIPINVKRNVYFSLFVKAKNRFPKVSLETSSGQRLLEPSSYNSKTSATELFDPDLSNGDSLTARVIMQGGFSGPFKIRMRSLGDLGDIRDAVIRQTNKQRRKKGLDPLTGDQLLHEAAQGHADEMDDVGQYLGHDSENGDGPCERLDRAGYRWRSCRENVASGQPTAKKVVQDWMNSPGHRANILADNIQEIGIGFAVDDATNQSYWVQKFATPA